MYTLFRELQRYVGFDEEDERTLRRLHGTLEPHFPRIVEVFYARVLEHTDSRAALQRGEKEVGQLKVTLVRWLNELFLGPWDENYVERRARIGRVHVEIGLPQHYMVSAMNVVRVQLREQLEKVVSGSPYESDRGRHAIERICDLDLALMLHTYRVDLEASQARAERLATFGQLVGSVGHELRNPLGVIETSLYVLKSNAAKSAAEADEKVTKHLDRIAQQVVLANDIITQLMNLIRERPVTRARVDVTTVANEALAPFGQTVICQVEPGTMVRGDATQIRQVLINLTQNALHFAGAEGRVEVSVMRQGGAVTMHVDDTGPGIDPSIRNRLFEPLVTTRPSGNGLGLALVKRIVENHGGSVGASRSPLGGARFTVVFPLEEGA